MHALNLSIEVEAGGVSVNKDLWLHTKFKTSLSYMKICLKQISEQTNKS